MNKRQPVSFSQSCDPARTGTVPSQCVHTNYHTNPFNTRKRAPFLMNRPATNVRLVSRHTPTLRWSSERGKAVYSLSSVVTNELDSHPPRRHAYTPYFTTKASRTWQKEGVAGFSQNKDLNRFFNGAIYYHERFTGVCTTGRYYLHPVPKGKF